MTSARKLVATIPETASPTMTPGCFEKSAKWPLLQSLDLAVAVRIPLRRMTLGEVNRLSVGDVIESEWPAAEEVPMYASDVVLSWCEFAVIDGAMAARLTRLG